MTGNTADIMGGAVYLMGQNSTLKATRMAFKNNTAGNQTACRLDPSSGQSSSRGGAVYVEGQTVAVDLGACTFAGNSGCQGGAVCNSAKSGLLGVASSHFSNNVAMQGGAVYLGPRILLDVQV